MLCHVFKVKHKLAPSYMNSFLVSQNTVHSYSTRLSEKCGFNLPKAKGSGCKSFSFIGAKLWNNLPCHLTDINNFQSFKVAIKSHLLNSSTFYNKLFFTTVTIFFTIVCLSGIGFYCTY